MEPTRPFAVPIKCLAMAQRARQMFLVHFCLGSSSRKGVLVQNGAVLPEVMDFKTSISHGL